jgi:Na+-transporting methylmalonyl-CoA/oxaloacetate decarboxylase gamma subunit
MIKLVFVFLVLVLLIAYAYHTVSEFTLREYKLAFKIGAFATAALLIMFIISQF